MSLIEVLVVIGMVGLITMGGAMIASEDLHKASIRDDRDRLEDALLLARSRSLIDTDPRSVRIAEHAFIVFDGSDFSTHDSSLEFPLPRSAANAHTEDISLVFGRGTPQEPLQYLLENRFIINVSESGRILSERIP
jgi:Tfp pilus assembly protein FimT